MKSPTRNYLTTYLAMWLAIISAAASFFVLIVMGVRYNDFGMIVALLVFGVAMGAIVYSSLTKEIGD